MENCIILRDVVIEILARLPVKSLIRFKCVCKFFYSLIKSDNHFKHKHFEISRAKRDYVVFQHNKPTFYEDRGFGLVYKESDSDEIGCVDLTFPTSGIDDVRYADGMFCLFNYVSLVNYVWDISIWNPSTREIKKLQNIKALDGYHREYTTMIGFGLSSNMIGKVVLIWITPDPIVMVCSLDDNNSCGWKRFSPSLDISDVDDHRSNLYLKGKYYWSCKIKDQNQIVWFDFDDETFGKIEFPEIHSSSWPAISAMKDTIALISCNIDMNQVEIWTMKEHNNIISWNKYASLEIISNLYTFPLTIWNLGAHLLVHDYHPLQLPGTNDVRNVKNFSSYDLIIQEKKIIYDVNWEICSSHPPFVYSESLKSF